MKEKNIQIDIAGRSFSIKVGEQDATVVLQAAQHINRKMSELEKTYKVRDKHDLLAMSVLQYVVEFHQKGNNNPLDEQALVKQISDINSLIPASV